MDCLPLGLYLIVLLDPVLASLPAPINVSVSSVNFRHVLRWDPAPGTPSGTQYRIVWRFRGRKWKRVHNSTTTSFKLKLHNKKMYYLTVQASYNHTLSPWSNTVPFTPYLNTIIGPPKLSLAGCGNCIQINISLPEADRHSQIDDIQEFYGASFTVFWKKEKEVKAVDFETKNKSFTLSNLEKGMEYCVQVHMKIRINKHTEPSAWNCTFTRPLEPRRGPAVLGAVSGLLIFVIILMITTFCLYYTGFLCKLKAAVPRALITALGQGYTLTPERTIPDWITINSGMGKGKKHNNPTALPPAIGEANSDVEDDNEDEEDWINIYLDRDPELSSGNVSGNSKPAVSRDSGSLAVRLSAEVEALQEEFNQDEVRAEGADGSFMHQWGQTGVQGQVTGEVEEEEMEEEMWDISGNVNLFSVTLAALAVEGDEEEKEEEEQNTEDSLTDFLKVSIIETFLSPDLKQILSHTDSQTESDDQTPEALIRLTHNKDFTVTGYEGRHADTLIHHEVPEEEEEEEQEAFSGYLGHR